MLSVYVCASLKHKLNDISKSWNSFSGHKEPTNKWHGLYKVWDSRHCEEPVEPMQSTRACQSIQTQVFGQPFSAKPNMPPSSTEPSDISFQFSKFLSLKDEVSEGQKQSLILFFNWKIILEHLLCASHVLGSRNITQSTETLALFAGSLSSSGGSWY